VRTTIDSGLQIAADSAMQSLPQSAAAVAVQPRPGASSPWPAHRRGHARDRPVAGRYPPGPAFTIVSTAALLAGGLNVNTQVPCHSVNDVGGRIFTNVPPEPGLGAQPAFEEDFAHACGTAFSGLSWRLNGRDLTAAASGFGLGAPWQLPLPSFFRIHADAQRRRGGRGGHDRRGQRPGEPARHGHGRGPRWPPAPGTRRR
jgi:cell division protein FtsI/penicillin-binding protein 2